MGNRKFYIDLNINEINTLKLILMKVSGSGKTPRLYVNTLLWSIQNLILKCNIPEDYYEDNKKFLKGTLSFKEWKKVDVYEMINAVKNGYEAKRTYKNNNSNSYEYITMRNNSVVYKYHSNLNLGLVEQLFSDDYQYEILEG